MNSSIVIIIINKEVKFRIPMFFIKKEYGVVGYISFKLYVFIEIKKI